MRLDSSFVTAWVAISAYGMLVVGILMTAAPLGYLGLRNRMVKPARIEAWRPRPAFQNQCRVVGILLVVLGLMILRAVHELA